MQDQIIFANLKYLTGFDKVVSSGMFSSYFFQVIFLLMMKFIMPRNIVSRKRCHFYFKRLILPKFECGCCEMLVFRVCGVRQNLHMYSLYRNPDLDDRIFYCLLASMAAVQAEDVRSSLVCG